MRGFYILKICGMIRFFHPSRRVAVRLHVALPGGLRAMRPSTHPASRDKRCCTKRQVIVNVVGARCALRLATEPVSLNALKKQRQRDGEFLLD